jgi:hypothetical protein
MTIFTHSFLDEWVLPEASDTSKLLGQYETSLIEHQILDGWGKIVSAPFIRGG